MAQNKRTMIDRKYHLFDAKGKVLGRLSTEIACILMGKNKVGYAPHIDGGDFVVVINTDEITVTGNKASKKMYHRFSGYPGGITSINFEDQLKKDSRKVLWQSVYNMLPKNALRGKMLPRLRLNKGNTHEETIIHVTHE
ncbi:MAG: 50S ribosomal protein L13 [Candidatus Moranbacteria bacterium]|nr:50S ribosomal protein L13 [Candidatus Moranbacteria bacterium]OIQ04047.1 MAG: 50S ribosomal protein L13 [Candidatus Moranbacteria bacterium CG2_30_41_165]PIP25260.1 MAG: 50S ribosomal protein L13 [Candidatus Moranbacteria bacterium CG23_combo_of_CG06-09_8_20_14_all_41_28]PIV86127.1 MAG: 50S ribosomal protein L13 [Candidatus Moranbacteria bacterium CG17_big_fil_post_rev_8_21_14_2_50_41_107]PIW94479.1 MAG: 50S ribosomal protein L13 [Candidatus Moranbacteria bacterium CG_4_8_14_3_um_filter_41_1